YAGGERARRRYAARAGCEPKNVYGESLFPLHVGTVLRRLSAHPLLEVLDARPRYLPGAARVVVRIPGVREVLTWNLEVLARRIVAGRSRMGPETCEDAGHGVPAG
ncbi:MAG: hypothetical protein ACRDXC_13320, partial [Acidimicrobiales bacterium]